MGTKGIQRFHCSRCPHRLTYLKGEPRQEGYIVLQFGQQYCTAGKKYRMFKKKIKPKSDYPLKTLYPRAFQTGQNHLIYYDFTTVE